VRSAILILALMLAAPAFADPLEFYKSDAKAGELERISIHLYATVTAALGGGGGMAFYSMHEGARLASDRTAAEASGRLIDENYGAIGRLIPQSVAL
jgi:hypothetical protein